MIPLLHTPEGVRDIYGNEKSEMTQIVSAISGCMKTYGYEEIQSPSFEYFDVFSSERGTVPSKDMYKFIDRDGNTLVLRPDMTPSIARSAVTYFKNRPVPIRLFYTGSTFINNSGYQLRLKETTQSGVELFGDDSAAADAEVIALTVECLKRAGLTEFQIEIGNAGFFRSVVTSCGISAEDEEELRKRVKGKNLFGISDFLTERSIEGKNRELILAIPELFGGEDILTRAASLTDNTAALAAIDRLQQIAKLLRLYGVERYVSFDLGMLSKYRYYTGIIFRAITHGTGEAIASGGRYDNLAEQFGEAMPAIGMSVTIDNLMLALERQNLLPKREEERHLIISSAEKTEQAVAEAIRMRSEGKVVSVSFADDAAEAAKIKAYAEQEGITVWNI